jgi:Rps23 Pro-64 3,4-dihydroxylase Tpa1-like proline 4-hydroxylase
MSIKVIKDAIPRSLCLAAEAAWPCPDWPFWHRYNGVSANKYGSMDRNRIPQACLAALDALALSVIPYIGDSFIDYDLHAAGMHMIPPGGFLGRHLDAECHPIRPWKRTHSIVLSVNSTWGELCGGQLVLESNLDSEPNTIIDVSPGQAVIFETPGQWHEVLRVNTDASLLHRKTLALFAWTQAECSGKTSAQFETKR